MEKIFTRKKENGILLGYFLGTQLIFPILSVFVLGYIFGIINFPLNDLELLNIFSTMTVSIPFFIVVVLLSKDVFVSGYNKIKDNLGDFFKKNLIRFVFILLGNMLIGAIIQIVFKVTADNQEIIIAQFKRFPIPLFFMIVFFAPIIEEIVYREIIMKKLSGKGYYFALIVSSLIFGFMHLLPSISQGNFLALIYIVQYSLLGGAFGFFLKKDETILSPMFIHLLNNLFVVILLFIAPKL